jgi:hypothetical protein
MNKQLEEIEEEAFRLAKIFLFLSVIANLVNLYKI